LWWPRSPSLRLPGSSRAPWAARLGNFLGGLRRDRRGYGGADRALPRWPRRGRPRFRGGLFGPLPRGPSGGGADDVAGRQLRRGLRQRRLRGGRRRRRRRILDVLADGFDIGAHALERIVVLDVVRHVVDLLLEVGHFRFAHRLLELMLEIGR